MTKSVQMFRLERIFVDIVITEKIWMTVFAFLFFTEGTVKHIKNK